ncbi:Zim17p [Nakaseomyces bracarensis]|uniref:Zim17p n=1 Tax=Nakaseomyces bracarensis TaxID=273131 RepID=UPI0038710BFA
MLSLRNAMSRVIPRAHVARSVLNRVMTGPVSMARRPVMTMGFRYVHSGRVLMNEKSDSTHLGSFKVDQPQIMIAFTCKKCDTRSSHVMSKQAYTGGTVLITCPGCHNRHLIADHLKIFNDDKITIEDIMRTRGESVSQSTEDLAFEDIPASLREKIGHHAKDAPEEYRSRMDNETVHQLPGEKDSKK